MKSFSFWYLLEKLLQLRNRVKSRDGKCSQAISIGLIILIATRENLRTLLSLSKRFSRSIRLLLLKRHNFAFSSLCFEGNRIKEKLQIEPMIKSLMAELH